MLVLTMGWCRRRRDTTTLLIISVVLLASLIKLNQAGFECLENPCAHGICIDDINSPHKCYCVDGFTGWGCEQNWDECRAATGISPCLNGGTCFDGIATFNCSCPEPFAGKLCEINLSRCDDTFPCQNNGTCTYSSDSPHETGLMCICPPGFTGLHCDEDVSVCNTTNNACVHGKCIDDIGKKFYCECEKGWSGNFCELSIDECASGPCLNGGICIDKIDDFSCACPFGYTGKACETKLDICDENPCRNEGFCLQERDEKICYCVPDYHGKRCEEKYDECDPPTKCSNGGTCIDGVGTFTCSCPPQFFGRTCQCSFDEVEMSTECSELLLNLNTTVLTTTTTTTTEGSVTTTTTSGISSPAETRGDGGNVSIIIPPDSTATSVVHEQSIPVTPTPVLESPLPPSPTQIISSDSPYDPGGIVSSWSSLLSQQSGIDDMSSEYFSRSSISIFYGGGSIVLTPTPSLITTYVEDTASAAAIDRQSDTYDPCPSLMVSIDETETVDQQPSVMMTGDILTPITTYIISTPTLDHIPSSQFNIIHSSRGGGGVGRDDDLELSTTMPFPSSSLFPLSASSLLDSNELIFEFPPAVLTSTLKTPILSTPVLIDSSSLWEVPDSSYPAISYGGYESQPVLAVTTVVGPSPSDNIIIVDNSSMMGGGQVSATASFVESSTVVVSSSSSEWEQVQSSPLPSSSVLSDLGVVSSSLSTRIMGEDISSLSTPLLPSSSLFPLFSSEIISITSPLLSSPLPSESDVAMLTPTATMYIPTESSSSVMVVTPPPATRNVTDPCENYCHNNAKCVSTSIEPICLCPFKYEGVQCEKMQEDVQIPSFAGESFLKYELQRATANIIEISAQMATVVPDGILLYSTIGKIYALIYIQNGLVTLHFSCGAQSMHFVETRTRVDNGFNFTLAFRLENVIHGQDELRCVGQVSLNESYSMKGEQIVDQATLSSAFEQPVKTVFLGGLDKPDLYTNDDIIRIMPGFRGCVYRLQVNDELLSMFQDAKDGREISECSTIGCVINPCAGLARCASSRRHPFWQCICPPGFEGIRCNLRTCGVNDCKNGATCTTIHNDNNTRQNFTNGLSSTVSRICLCPLGFNGDLCQSKINVTRPAFHPTTDYSSFIAFDPIPRFADWMQLKFHFITKNMSQFALLVYAGSDLENVNIILKQQQQDQQQLESPPVYEHDQYFPASDFFAITFIQGFIALTWNLGSGSQRITTPSRIDSQLNVHTLLAGRQGRQAWLKVDGMRNTTGKTPGPLYRLNVNSDLYVGGHELPRFEGLPHDIPLHSGFHGCIFDLGFRVKNKLFIPRPIRARNVNNCYEDC